MIHKEIGFAGDLFQPSLKSFALNGRLHGAQVKTLITLSDLFILHDKIFLRADTVTLRDLFRYLSIDELRVLIENDRIGFYKPYFPFRTNTYKDYEAKIGEHLTNNKDWLYDENFDVSKAEKLIFDNIVPPKTTETFEDFKDVMFDLFYNNELMKDRDIPMNNQIGFEEGVARVRELWYSGITAINYDWEFHRYLDICNKAAFFKQKELNLKVVDPEKSIIEDLHKFKNIPSIAELLVNTDDPNKLFLEVVNSKETDDFRQWIRSLDTENIDIRDAYEKEMKSMPSKNKWTDWLRFGSVNVISSVLGTVLTSNPYFGFLIGTGISTVDKLYGDKALDITSEKYNPVSWISFIESKT